MLRNEIFFCLRHPLVCLKTVIAREKVEGGWQVAPEGYSREGFPDLTLRKAAEAFGYVEPKPQEERASLPKAA